MFNFFNKKEKSKRGIKFRLNGVDFICIGMNAASVEMAIIQRAKLVYAKNVLDGRTHGINPMWVADYVSVEYYRDGTWEVI